MNELVVEAAEVGERLDLFVGKRLKLSRAKLKELFEADRVRVDGRKAKKGQTVAQGQKVHVEVPVEGPRAPVAEEGPLSVLYADEAVVFVDKPAGMPVHPLESGETGTVANLLVARYPEVIDASEDVREAGLAHRLDIDTSGVLCVARTQAAWSRLREQFSASGAAKKLYLALVSGPLADEGEIDVPLVQHKDHVRPALSSDEAARPALSQFKVLRREGLYALVEVQIFTGVMHQVRAHLASVGAPIVGDVTYGGEARRDEKERLFLHAASLEVTHPVSGARLKVDAPLPKVLEVMLAARGL